MSESSASGGSASGGREEVNEEHGVQVLWLWIKGKGDREENKAVEVWLLSLERRTKKGAGKGECGCEAKDEAQRGNQGIGNAVVKHRNKG